MGIVLIGFMGSGKTSLGRALALELGLSFYDTDTLVEKKYGSINAIFESFGEVKFRKMETEAIKEIAEIENAIIATGGGIVVTPQNIEFLRNNNIIVWLKCSYNDIINRLKEDINRPLWDKSKDMRNFFIYREQLYHKYADIIVLNINFNDTLQQLKQIYIER